MRAIRDHSKSGVRRPKALRLWHCECMLVYVELHFFPLLKSSNSDLLTSLFDLNDAFGFLIDIHSYNHRISSNDYQTKEELEKETLAYNEVRNADMIVLQERQTNMAVSAFILVFSACPDALSASSMIQTSAAPVNRRIFFFLATQSGCHNLCSLARLIQSVLIH